MIGALIAFGCGALAGFVLSVPALGPLLALVVLAGANGDWRRGLALAVGGAVAESAWALLAFWGLSRLVNEHAAWIPFLRGASAVLLVAIAIALVRASHRAPSPPEATRGAGPALVGFALVALNPGFPLTWASVATALYASELVPASAKLAVPLALGVLVGIVAWFGLVLYASRRLGRQLGDRVARRGSVIVAIVLFGAAAWLAISAARA